MSTLALFWAQQKRKANRLKHTSRPGPARNYNHMTTTVNVARDCSVALYTVPAVEQFRVSLPRCGLSSYCSRSVILWNQLKMKCSSEWTDAQQVPEPCESPNVPPFNKLANQPVHKLPPMEIPFQISFQSPSSPLPPTPEPDIMMMVSSS